MKIVKAFAPANLSCFFKIYESSDPRWRGSFGLGFTLSEGVVVEVRSRIKSGMTGEVFFNKKQINFAPVELVIKLLTKKKIKVNIKTSLPLGCGFGLSGASTLATAFAINKLLDLGKSERDLAILAHSAEAASGTGLGDTINQYFGGALVKFDPSSKLIVERVNLENANIYCKSFGKLNTKLIIQNPDFIKKTEQTTDIALNKIKNLINKNNKIALAKILKISKDFALESELLKDEQIIKIINDIENRGGNASMMMLGRGVMSDIDFEGAEKFEIADNKASLC